MSSVPSRSVEHPREIERRMALPSGIPLGSTLPLGGLGKGGAAGVVKFPHDTQSVNPGVPDT